MPTLRDLRKIDVEYATTGPNHNVITQTVAKPADVLFRALAD